VSEPVGWRPGRVAAWSLYDFANSPYSTIMTTVGFPSFFLAVIAPGPSGALLWGLLYGLSEVAAACLSPALGALSDARGRRKPFLVTFSLLCVAGTALCALVGPGDLATTCLCFGLANLGFAVAQVFYNALLVEVAPPGRTDTVSGIGFATGYVGGLVGLLIAGPLYRGGTGVSNLAGVHLSFLVVAAIFLIFSVPVFLLKEAGTPSGAATGLGAAYGRVWETLRSIRRYRALFWFLLASFCFNDGVNTVILFAGPFAEKVLGMGTPDVVKLFLLLNVVAAVGAFSVGRLADKVGSRRTLLGILVCWVGVAVAMALVRTPAQFTLLAAVAGFLLGPTQSVSRGFLARLAPPDMEGEFFGFFGLAGKFAALVGPVLFGAVSAAAGTMRAGALALAPVFVLSALFLLRVPEAEAPSEGSPSP